MQRTVSTRRDGIALGLALGVCVVAFAQERATTMEQSNAMQLTSAAFEQGAGIPARYTCDGENLSPPLAWAGVPPGTKTLALIADDPDAPMGTWVHWVVYNLPTSTAGLPEGYAADPQRSDGTCQGVTDFHRTGYGGPCPPSGTHRYFFTLYALDTACSLAPGATAKELEAAMRGHILAQAQLMGTYRRRGR